MSRTRYYNYIDEKLHILAHRIATGGKLNMLSLHMHSENFYLHLFNILYDSNLENLNQYLQNVEAIDLVDHDNKIVIQVSSTNTKKKVESTLLKKIMIQYSNYTFKFISIAHDASNLRKKDFVNPHGITFDPSTDIYDTTSILNKILSFDIDRQKTVYENIKKELGGEIDIVLILNTLLEKERKLSSAISKSDSFEELENLIVELNEKYKNKGEYESIIQQLEEVDNNLESYEGELELIDKELFSGSFEATVKRQLNKFNKYFSSTSDLLYGEQYALK